MYTTEWWPWYEDESHSFGLVTYGFSTRDECYDMRCLWLIPMPGFPS